MTSKVLAMSRRVPAARTFSEDLPYGGNAAVGQKKALFCGGKTGTLPVRNAFLPLLHPPVRRRAWIICHLNRGYEAVVGNLWSSKLFVKRNFGFLLENYAEIRLGAECLGRPDIRWAMVPYRDVNSVCGAQPTVWVPPSPGTRVG
jgi:hypothetical protein